MNLDPEKNGCTRATRGWVDDTRCGVPGCHFCKLLSWMIKCETIGLLKGKSNGFYGHWKNQSLWNVEYALCSVPYSVVSVNCFLGLLQSERHITLKSTKHFLPCNFDIWPLTLTFKLDFEKPLTQHPCLNSGQYICPFSCERETHWCTHHVKILFFIIKTYYDIMF